MTTQYTSILKLALPVQGELSGTWGDVVNDNITSMVEEAIAGRAVINTWTTNSHTLTSANGTTSESRCAMLEFTDTGTALSGDATVICPTAAKIYICKNDAGQKVTIKTSSGTGVAIADGQTMFVFCDGTNVVEAVTSMSSLKLGTAATSVQVTAVLDEDDLVSDSATALATQQSIKAYVDSQVTAQDLDFAGDTGTGAVDLDSQSLTIAGTSNEIETSASGQTLTVGLPAAVTVTTSVTTPTVQVTDVKANDGTAAVSIANTTGQTTITDAVLTTADINAGTIDNTTIGATTASTGAFTTITSSGNTTVSGSLVTDTIAEETATAGVTVDSVLLKDGGATLTGNLVVDTDTLYVDSANNTVGFGTSSPQARIDSSAVSNFSVTYNNFTGDGLHIQSTGTAGDGAYAGGISFSRISADNNSRAAGIAAVQTDSDADRVGLAFFTHPDATTSNDLSEAMRIDAAQRVLIGHTSALTTQGGPLKAQIVGANATSGLDIFTGGASALPRLNFTRSRNATPGSFTIVQDGDLLGLLSFMGDDSADYQPRGAQIKAEVDGTPGINDMPGRLIFATTSDGADSTTERMRIDNAGRVSIGGVGPAAWGSAYDVLTVGSSVGGANYAGSSNAMFLTTNAYNDNTNWKYATSAAATAYTQYGGSHTWQYAGSGTAGNNITWTTGLAIDTSGRMLVGLSSSISGYSVQTARTDGTVGFSALRYSADAYGAYMVMSKSRNSTINGNTVVQSGDALGYINWAGNDGTDMNSLAAGIWGEVDGTPGSNDMPGRLVFKTTADGAASSTERMRINNSGYVGIGNAIDGATWLHVKATSTSGRGQVSIEGSGATDDARLSFYTGGSYKLDIFADHSDNGARYDVPTGDYQAWTIQGTKKNAISSSGYFINSAAAEVTSGTPIASSAQAGIQALTNATYINLALASYGNNGGGSVLAMGHSRSSTVNSPGTIVQSGDNLGAIRFAGDDGTDFQTSAAQILAYVDGAPGANDMPGRIVFSTTADGASSVTERWRIDSNGNFIGNGGYVSYNVWQANDHQGTSGNNLHYWKLGTWENVGGGDSCHIEIHATTSYSNGSGPSGTTVIDLRRDNSSVDDGALEGTFYSRTAGANPAITSVYYKPINSRTGFEIYVKAGSFAQIAPFVKVSGGSTFAADTVDTGSTSAPSGSYNGSIYSTSYFYQGAGGNNTTWPARVGFRSNGNIVIESGAGIEFADAGGTGTSTSNTLDSYEEGTWTPIYQNASADPSLTYSEQTGYYTKIGDTVHLWFRVIAGTVTTQGTGALLVGGFPFLVKNSTSNYASINVAYSSSWTTAPEGGHTEPNRYYGYLKYSDANGNLANNLGNITSGDDVIAQITYKTA